MSVRAGRRLLISAFALSILIHVLAARLVHWSVPTPQEPERITVAHVAILRVPKRTPPPQTPKPAPTATVAAPPHARKVPVTVPHVRPRSGPGALPVTALAPAATASPSPRPIAHLPTPAPAGGCADPNAPAAVRATAAPPDISTAARVNAKRAVAQIRVGLSEKGEVTGALVESSTGNDQLDAVAVEMARGATYAPALSQCKAVAGSYVFRVKFTTP